MDLLVVCRPAPESSDRLVLTADPVVVVVVVMVVIVVAGAEADEPRLPLLDPFFLLSHPRQLISRLLARAPVTVSCRLEEELGSRPGAGLPRQPRNGRPCRPCVSGEDWKSGAGWPCKAGWCFVLVARARGRCERAEFREGGRRSRRRGRR